MIEVMLTDGYRFRMYPEALPPPHVHVERDGCWCVIEIGDADQAPSVAEEGDMRRTDAGRAVWIVNRCQEILLAHWRRVHAPRPDTGRD